MAVFFCPADLTAFGSASLPRPSSTAGDLEAYSLDIVLRS